MCHWQSALNFVNRCCILVSEKDKIELPGLTLSFKLDLSEPQLSPRRSPDGKESK